jgi:nitrite reductase (NADH) small subunit
MSNTYALDRSDDSSNNMHVDPTQWHRVCEVSDLVMNSGVCALVNNIQIAIFALEYSDAQFPTLFAVNNFDPIGKANVMSRGILGSIEQEAVVASPLYKHHFKLNSGQCVQMPEVSLMTYQIRCDQSDVYVALPDSALTSAISQKS